MIGVKLSVFFLVFIGSYGVQNPDCDSESAVLTALNCSATLLDLIDIKKAHPEDYESLKAYLESCEHFMTCDQSYKCQNSSKYAGDIKNHKSKCTDNLHILKEFRNCEGKLREANSEKRIVWSKRRWRGVGRHRVIGIRRS